MAKFEVAGLLSSVAIVPFALARGFIHFDSGGFAGQLVWGFALLPGILPAQALGLIADKAPAPIGTILFGAALVFFNLLWYWVVSYVVVKFARRSKLWDGF